MPVSVRPARGRASLESRDCRRTLLVDSSRPPGSAGGRGAEGRHVRFASPPQQRVREERPPGGDGLVGPDPHSARDADDERHEDAQHVHLHCGNGLVQRAVNSAAADLGRRRRRRAVHQPAVGGAPDDVPLRHVETRVEVTPDDTRRRQRVEDSEDADLRHKLLQFAHVRRAVLAQVAPDTEHGDEAGEDEESADEEVEDEGGEGEGDERAAVLTAHEAHAGQLVAVYPPQSQHDDRLDGRHRPRRQVEVAAERLDRLATPLLTGRQEPGECEHHPPDGARHAEEVEEEEDDDAPRVVEPLLDEEVDVGARPVARHGRSADDGPYEIGERIEHVTHGEEDDRPLGVLEAVGVDKKCEYGEQAGDEADARPYRHPDGGEALVLAPEEHVDAAASGTRLVAPWVVDAHVPVRAGGLHRRGRAAPRVHQRAAAPQGLQQLCPLGVLREAAEHRVPPVGWRRIVHVGGLHAQTSSLALLRQVFAVEYRRPAEFEAKQDRLAFRLYLQTHGATGWDDQGLVHLLRAHGSVEGTEEELEKPRATELYKRDEFVELRRRILLVRVADQVRHPCHVIAHVAAHRDRDPLTSAGVRLAEGL